MNILHVVVGALLAVGVFFVLYCLWAAWMFKRALKMFKTASADALKALALEQERALWRNEGISTSRSAKGTGSR